MNTKTIYFDMDGTIANLYGVRNWLPRLRSEDATPYLEAEPMCDMVRVIELLEALCAQGYRIGIISWLSMGASKAYKKEVTRNKKRWLNQEMPIEFDEMHFIQYGTPKHRVARDKFGIIIDDSSEVRAGWEKRNNRIAVDPAEMPIENFLLSLLS